jgi:hypothetical protein
MLPAGARDGGSKGEGTSGNIAGIRVDRNIFQA